MKTTKTIDDIGKIYDKRSAGLCESCDYGIDKCFSDGKPKCLQKEVNDDVKKESV